MPISGVGSCGSSSRSKSSLSDADAQPCSADRRSIPVNRSSTVVHRRGTSSAAASSPASSSLSEYMEMANAASQSSSSGATKAQIEMRKSTEFAASRWSSGRSAVAADNNDCAKDAGKEEGYMDMKVGSHTVAGRTCYYYSLLLVRYVPPPLGRERPVRRGRGGIDENDHRSLRPTSC